jgi:hypothetical protein
MLGSYLKQATLFVILSNICYLAVTALYPRFQWPFAGWDYGFESRPGPWMFVSCIVCCQRSLRGADNSSGRFLPALVCVSVIVKLLELGSSGPLGAIA